MGSRKKGRRGVRNGRGGAKESLGRKGKEIERWLIEEVMEWKMGN